MEELEKILQRSKEIFETYPESCEEYGKVRIFIKKLEEKIESANRKIKHA